MPTKVRVITNSRSPTVAEALLLSRFVFRFTLKKQNVLYAAKLKHTSSGARAMHDYWSEAFIEEVQ